jgi:hypothetical protein
LTKTGGGSTISPLGVGVLTIGKINPKHFENVFPIQTDDVIITDERLAHIKKRHPQDYERYAEYIPRILEQPDYIIEANKPNSAVMLKTIAEDGKEYQLILRLRAATDPANYRNSVITFSRIHAKEYRRIVRNKKILYKSE